MAALGALGHTLVEMDESRRDEERARLLQYVQQVNWNKGQHWEGIAGKFTPKGEFSVGGPKETAYAIYTALKDGDSGARRTGFRGEAEQRSGLMANTIPG